MHALLMLACSGLKTPSLSPPPHSEGYRDAVVLVPGQPLTVQVRHHGGIGGAEVRHPGAAGTAALQAREELQTPPCSRRRAQPLSRPSA